ncbi:MAG: hypothetical protein WBZ48_13105, partial [Bacteroidota bacterium]
YEAYETRGEAVKQERWYKTGIGHARVKELIAIYLKEKAAIASHAAEVNDPDNRAVGAKKMHLQRKTWKPDVNSGFVFFLTPPLITPTFSH